MRSALRSLDKESMKPTHERSSAGRPTRTRPNVLLIVSEDNGQHMGCYGDTNVQTPRLDALAAEGARFADAYCTQAVCSPGRASILTGLYPHQNGQIGLSTHEYAMYDGVANLPGLLKPLGYRTGLLGKLHVKPYSDFPWDLWWNDGEYISFHKRDVYKTAEMAREFIEGTGDDPFLLMVAARDCHLPFLRQCEGVPEHPLSGEDVSPLPFVGVDTPRIREHTADYYNCMQRLDVTVGLLLDVLRSCGKEQDTLVIFTTDHGAQFARGKCSCYEGGLRIPMIARWPGRIPEGVVVDGLVSQVDVLPTIMSAVGGEVPPHVAGSSLLPLMAGEAVEWRDHICAEWTSCHPPLFYPQRSIRDGRYKLIVTYQAGRPSPCAQINTGTATFQARIEPGTLPEEIELADERVQRTYEQCENPPPELLYDLQEDPWEFNDLAGDPQYDDIKGRLRSLLATWQRETGDFAQDPELLARLTAEQEAARQEYYGGGVRSRMPEGHVWPYRGYLASAD